MAAIPYNPQLHTESNKSYGMGQPGPTDARSHFYDTNFFTYRPYQDSQEVCEYLDDHTLREGKFSVFIGTAGQPVTEWWFKDGTEDADLVQKGGGSAPGLQQVLDTDSNLTKENWILLNGSTLNIADELPVPDGYSIVNVTSNFIQVLINNPFFLANLSAGSLAIARGSETANINGSQFTLYGPNASFALSSNDGVIQSQLLASKEAMGFSTSIQSTLKTFGWTVGFAAIEDTYGIQFSMFDGSNNETTVYFRLSTTGFLFLPSLKNCTSDADAEAQNVPLNGVYRIGNTLKLHTGVEDSAQNLQQTLDAGTTLTKDNIILQATHNIIFQDGNVIVKNGAFSLYQASGAGIDVHGVFINKSVNPGFVKTITIDQPNTDIRLVCGNADGGGGMQRDPSNNEGRLKVYSFAGTIENTIQLIVGQTSAAPVVAVEIKRQLGATAPTSVKVNQPLLLPRVSTTDRDDVTKTEQTEGMMVYNLTTHKINYRDNVGWKELTGT